MTTPVKFHMYQQCTNAWVLTRASEEGIAAECEARRPNLETYDLILDYTLGPSERVNAQGWYEQYKARQNAPQSPMPAFYSEAPQKQLVAALDRYNVRYDNTAYLAACHSLRLIEDQPEYIQQAIRIQDVALYLCGAQNLPCISPTRITREMVLFWMNFASDQPQDDDAEDLPF